MSQTPNPMDAMVAFWKDAMSRMGAVAAGAGQGTTPSGSAPGTDPMGRKHYWFTVIPLEPAEEGTDRWAIEQGLVSITPLRLDLTDHAFLQKAPESGIHHKTS